MQGGAGRQLFCRFSRTGRAEREPDCGSDVAVCDSDEVEAAANKGTLRGLVQLWLNGWQSPDTHTIGPVCV